MEKTIHRIVTLKELYERWRRNEYWLDDFCLRDEIEVYVVDFKDSHEEINRGRILDYYVIGGYSPGILGRSDVVFDEDEVERIEKEHPEVIAPPPPPAPPWGAWGAPKAPSAILSPPAVSALSSTPGEAQARIAYIERQLEEITRERDKALQGKKELANRVAELEKALGASRATIEKQKKHAQTLVAGYEGVSKLVCEINRQGKKAGGNPWTEGEVLALANELGVSLKGDCLKAFKAGMSADLVKKDAGARPITLHEESPGNGES